jgi:hypothetical protein
MARQRLPKQRSPDWLLLSSAAEGAIKDLHTAWEILGAHGRQIEGWNKEHEGACGHIGNSNLLLSRDYIISAVDRLRLAQKGVVAP